MNRLKAFDDMFTQFNRVDECFSRTVGQTNRIVTAKTRCIIAQSSNYNVLLESDGGATRHKNKKYKNALRSTVIKSIPQ